ncbi:MAG: RHS repeat-associated core domain-containing protein [Cytophagales bacterium]
MKTTRFYSIDFEKEISTTGQKLIHYIDGAFGTAAIYIVENNVGQMYYPCTDYLGSLMMLLREDGSVAQENSFDAWGRARNPLNYILFDPGQIPSGNQLLNRGFTGHEHNYELGLVNMNGRFYDPLLCQMISPDNFVKFLDNTQIFNRYSYCLNNPAKFVDKSGELLGLAYFIGKISMIGTLVNGVADFVYTAFVNGGLDPTSSVARNNAWARFDPTSQSSKTHKSWRITEGLIKTDASRSWDKRAGQLLTRFTWEAPQTLLGNIYSHSRVLVNKADRVDHYGGVTFVTNENSASRSGVSIGNYINMNIWDEVGDNFEERVTSDPLYMHEYGHTFDSQIFGPTYLYVIGIPSLTSAATSRPMNNQPNNTHHDFRWYEMRANRHAARYFRNKGRGVDWESDHEELFPTRKR